MLVTSYTVAALYLRSTSVPLATLIGVYYSFLLYIVLLVRKEALYLIFTVLYAFPKRF